MCFYEHKLTHTFNHDLNIWVVPLVLRVVWHFDESKQLPHVFIICNQTSLLDQSMVGVPKRTISFYIPWTPSFKTCCNLMAYSYWKFDFFSWINTILKYYSMYSMSNLDKFKNSYQVLENNPRFCLFFKKSSKIHRECLNNFFWPKILSTNTLGINIHKMYECDKNQMPYCNVKNFKKWNFWEFWAIDRTWPTLDKFYYSYFHKWKK
jgi:hypothetical protein